MFRRPWLSAACLCLLAINARAQDEAAATIQVEESEAVEPPVAELEPMLVTGELLVREAERSATSVAVRTGEDIERSTVSNVYDVIRETPNAAWHDSELGLSSLTLRGIGSYGASQVGSGTIYGTATAIVLDGVALPRGAMGFADLSAFDLSQVEIFRGPQSTSQGRNAMAGAVIVSTVEPEIGGAFAPDLHARLAGGSLASWQGAGAAGATLLADRLAARVVTDHRATEGDIPNVTRGEPEWAGDSNHGTRLRLAFAPAGPDGAYSASLAIGDNRRATGSRYVEQSREDERVATANEPTGIVNEAQLLSLDQRLGLGEEWSLRALSAWAQSDVRMRFDVDYTAENEGFIGQLAESHGFTQELRAGYAGEAWRATLGLYYFDGVDGEASYGTIPLQPLLAAAGLCPVPEACIAPLGNLLVDADAPARFENAAIFGETDWQASERLTVTAGLRYDRERNSRRVSNNFAGDSPDSQAAVLALQTSGVLGANGRTDVGRSFSAVLPKLALSYELFDKAFLGAAWTEGYRPGGEGYNYGSGRRYRFDAERTRNYELSYKARLTPGRTLFALNLFRTEWTDMQVPVGSLLDSYIANAGRSRIRGGEMEFRASPLDSLRVVAGFGITHGRFLDFNSTAGDFSGNPLPKAPKHGVNLALEWTPLSDLLVRPEVQRVGHTPAQADNGPTHQLPAYTLLNLALRWTPAWTGTRLGFFFNGSNLADRSYRQGAITAGLRGSEIAALGQGRLLVGGIEMGF